jgi:hypothetical protein
VLTLTVEMEDVALLPFSLGQLLVDFLILLLYLSSLIVVESSYE